MYAPNEYYKPYNPSRSRERYRDRQRLPPQYVGVDKDKPPTPGSFRMLQDTPPPPTSLNTTFSSLNTMDDLIPDKRDRTECYCRISSLVKAFIFLGIILGATVGLVIFFLNSNNTSSKDLLKDTNSDVTNVVDNISPTFLPEPRVKTSENSKINEVNSVSSRKTVKQTQKPNITIKSSRNNNKTHSGKVEISEVDIDGDIKSDKDTIKSEYEKVLSGFGDDGEFNLSVESFLDNLEDTNTSKSSADADKTVTNIDHDTFTTTLTNDHHDDDTTAEYPEHEDEETTSPISEEGKLIMLTLFFSNSDIVYVRNAVTD